MSIPIVTLSDGRTIPALGFGCGTGESFPYVPWFGANALFAISAHIGQDCSDAVKLALSEGFHHLDGAEYYSNDEYIGVGLRGSDVPRQDIWYTTKCHSNPRTSLETALKALDIQYFDLFLLHSPEFFDDIGLARAWELCEEMQREGLCKSIGVSNFRVRDLEELKKTAKVMPVVNQIEFHPYVYKQEKPLIDYCKANNIAVAAYAPLTSLTHAKGGPVDEIVDEIAASMKYTPGQVLLKWCQQVGPQIVISTSSKAQRLQEYKTAFTSMPDLTTEQVDAIVKQASLHHHRQFFTHMDAP